MRSIRFPFLLILILLGLGCADKTPVGFKFELPPAITSTSHFPLRLKVLNKRGEVIMSRSASLSASPADVLEVEPSGNLRCTKTGDATLTLAAAGFSQPVPVRCRIPTEIAVPGELHL